MKIQNNKVVLVDQHDNAIGEMEKLEAHQLGQLHRAFSVFILNDKDEFLLQRRAIQKYHGAGLWTNTCCSHPGWDEDIKDSAESRLWFEMGLKCELEFSHSFIYKANVENNLIEHEFDHVFVGYSNDQPQINPEEVMDYKWMSLDKILNDVYYRPEKFTYWFKAALPKLMHQLKNKRQYQC